MTFNFASQSSPCHDFYRMLNLDHTLVQAIDQIVNSAGKTYYMSGGNV